MCKNETDVKHILQVHGSALYRSAWLMLGNSYDVQDILQEVLLRYLEKSPAFGSVEHEKAWLMRVTANCCKDYLRFRKRHLYTDLESLKECLPCPEQREHLEELYALPARYKTVLILYYFEGYSVTEIAQIIKISKSAVKKRLQRGRETLKLAITDPQINAGPQTDFTAKDLQHPITKLTKIKKESYSS